MENFNLGFEISEYAESVVMVSGGPDSICLLDLINKSGLFSKVHALYINHADKGSFSSKAVEKLCQKVGVYNFTAIELPEQKRPSETRWRLDRYRELNKFIDTNTGIKYAFTGHHEDDQVENYIISIFKNRINNIEIPFCRTIGDAKLIRPLLLCTKKEILEYCKTNNIAYLTDETNSEGFNIRNVIRNHLIPSIEKLKDFDQYFNSLSKFINRYKALENMLSINGNKYIEENTSVVFSQSEFEIELFEFDKLQEIEKEFVLKKLVLEYTDDNMSEGAIVSFHRVSNCDKFKNGEITFQINQWCNLSYSKKLDTYVLKGDSPVT